MATATRSHKKRREPGDEFMPQLPYFEIIDRYRLDIGGRERRVVEIRCPRAECRKPFVVLAKSWRTSGRLPTRPCPYCFKTSKLPRKSE